MLKTIAVWEYFKIKGYEESVSPLSKKRFQFRREKKRHEELRRRADQESEP
jgi:hypothetical protein